MVKLLFSRKLNYKDKFTILLIYICEKIDIVLKYIFLFTLFPIYCLYLLSAHIIQDINNNGRFILVGKITKKLFPKFKERLKEKLKK